MTREQVRKHGAHTVYSERPLEQEPITSVYCFNRNGEKINEEEANTKFMQKHEVFAKHIVKENYNNYYVVVYRSNIYDPQGQFCHLEHTLDLKLHKINKAGFDLYLTYLKTRNNGFLTRAQRELTNER